MTDSNTNYVQLFIETRNPQNDDPNMGLVLSFFNSVKTEYLARKIQFYEHKPGEIISEPTMYISRKELQQWLDEIWKIGIRPSNDDSSVTKIEKLKEKIEFLSKLTEQLFDRIRETINE